MIWSFLVWLTLIALLIGLMGVNRKLSLWVAIALLPSISVYALHRITRLSMANSYSMLMCISMVAPLGVFRLLTMLISAENGQSLNAIGALVTLPFIVWFGLSWGVVYSIWNCVLLFYIHLTWSSVIELVKRRQQDLRLARDR